MLDCFTVLTAERQKRRLLIPVENVQLAKPYPTKLVPGVVTI